MKTVGIIIAGILGFFVLLLVIGAIIGTVAGPESPPTAQHEDPPRRDMLAVFCNIVDESRALYEKADKAAPLEKDEARRRAVENRARALQREFADGSVENWKVELDEIFLADNDRNVRLEIKLPCDAVLKTSSDHAIQTNSPLYSALKALRRGDKITVSGQFVIDHKDDFFNEMSITQSGSMEEPEYLFRVTTINGIQEPPDLPMHPEVAAQHDIADRFKESFLKRAKSVTSSKVEIEDFDLDHRTFRFAIIYPRKAKISAKRFLNESGKVGAEAFQILMNQNIKPSQLTVWVRQDAGVGVTGTPLVRLFGRASYNEFDDRFEWLPYKN